MAVADKMGVAVSVAENFRSFIENLKVSNTDVISNRYGEITAAINKKFRDSDSKTANSLQVGSYGRHTAIDGISDLDMLYIMPPSSWDDYKDKGQSKLLTATKDAIKTRYPNTDVYVDRLVVRVLYADFHVEAQPVFEQEDGSFKYPDTYDGGTWKVTMPRDEIKAISEFNEQKNKNLRRLCKMARSWKNKHGVGMGGLLIDTLSYNFLRSTTEYDENSFLYYDYMSRDFFKYLSELPDQDYYAALGSGQRVRVKKKFQKIAKKAYDLCLKAIEAAGKDNENDKWRKVYGRQFPAMTAGLQKATASAVAYRETEEFVEDRFPVDIRYPITIDCDVSQNGFREYLLRDILRLKLPLKPHKTLKFHVVNHEIPGEFRLYWKILNRGEEAVKRDCVRGQLVMDAGKLEKSETTTFRGDHIAECYAVQRGVLVAKDRIHVPIDSNAA
ncbi:SMODS domain-containing nucleotidyltransferase [Mesorhizobium sp. BR-1-1-10]|uniref:SMODS domain-containing nucleotidyltransferase n=1 Tax=Mesorhizobium sp. BR-1-1-10 TaxID=2876660 RepID=UPI001CD1023E|nr:nucleotidyltransferase [Mesorhizobium sp. BR-1-1-10]MBZ9977817.1 nucleotidyltransferase [Mesorhizobium sp. BR-1-1-10]